MMTRDTLPQRKYVLGWHILLQYMALMTCMYDGHGT
jgi:hypothetical protein